MKTKNLKRLFLSSFFSKKGEVDLTGENVNLPDESPTQEEQEQEIQVDYNELAKINRDYQRKANEASKSYLASLGLNDDQIKNAMANQKNNEKQKQKATNDDLSNALKRIEELERINKEKDLAISRSNLTSTTKELLKSMELKDKAISLFNKTIDENKAIKEDGTIDNDYVKKVMEDFKKEYPEFIVVKETSQPQKKPGAKVQTGIDNGSNNEPQNININKLSASEKWRLYYENKQ